MSPSTIQAVERARSLLFVPGNRPDRFDRALGSGADVVVLDLEDSVGPEEKDVARRHAIDFLGRTSGVPVVIRINDPGTSAGSSDAASLAATQNPLVVMIPKAGDPAAIREVVGRLPSGSAVVPLVETPMGILHAYDLARLDEVIRLAFGHLDLSAELGISPDDLVRLSPARFTLVAASAAAKLPPPVDGVCTDVRDSDRMVKDAQESLASGMTGKLCIHPSQVPLVHRAFAPGEEELSWAERVLAQATEHDVAVVDGHMVDRPVYLRARSIATRAGLSLPTSSDRAPTPSQGER